MTQTWRGPPAFVLCTFCVLLLLLIRAATCAGDESDWMSIARGRVGTLKTAYTAVAYYVPKVPTRVLVLAHGYPWPDGTQSDDALAAYAREDTERWVTFAEQNHTIILAPAFGGRSFAGYREMAVRNGEECLGAPTRKLASCGDRGSGAGARRDRDGDPRTRPFQCGSAVS
jgi:hypothetical protein